MTEELYAQVKDKCNITWEDADTRRRVERIIKTAIPDMIHRLGITDKNFDFSTDSEENTIFLNRCFYEWNHALNEFYVNYADSIAQIRAINEVKQYLESEESESE